MCIVTVVSRPTSEVEKVKCHLLSHGFFTLNLSNQNFSCLMPKKDFDYKTVTFLLGKYENHLPLHHVSFL